MGFGLVFFGFFFLLRMQLSGIDITPDFVGCLIMLAGLGRLIVYCRGNRWFAYARWVLLSMTVLTFVEFVFQLLAAVGELPDDVAAYAYTPVSYTVAAAVGAFTVLLLLGIHKLSLEVELPKLAGRAGRFIALTAVYYLFELLSETGALKALSELAAEPQVMLSLCNAAVLLLSLVWFLGVLLLIFNCYMRICLEGDEDMPYRDNAYDRTLRRLKGKKKK